MFKEDVGNTWSKHHTNYSENGRRVCYTCKKKLKSVDLNVVQVFICDIILIVIKFLFIKSKMIMIILIKKYVVLMIMIKNALKKYILSPGWVKTISIRKQRIKGRPAEANHCFTTRIAVIQVSFFFN
jgi:hypothetical protein